MGLVADERLENRQHVAAIFEHTIKSVAQSRFALSFAMPTSQHVGRDFDIAAKFFGGMTAQKEAVEKGGLPLRVLKIPLRLVGDYGRCPHGRKGSLPKVKAASRGTRGAD